VRLLAALALTPLPYVLQGGGSAVPAVALLATGLVCLAGLLPSEQSWTSRRRRLLL
jgi:hypothetical protein